jgi:2-haloacid dehalogenase
MRTAFDVYGTLVDPLAMANHLKLLVGDLASRFAELWCIKPLEYSFRRGLTRTYQPFSDGHLLAAFSNGEAAVVREVLENAEVLSLLDDVISADEVRTFKPDPTMYAHAVRRLGQDANATWLVSSNPFDVIGAKTAGLRAA